MSSFSQHGEQLANALTQLDKKKRDSVAEPPEDSEQVNGKESPKSVRFKVPKPLNIDRKDGPNGTTPLADAFDPLSPSPKTQKSPKTPERRTSQQVASVTTQFESGRFSVTSKEKRKKKMKPTDFDIGDELGRGAYAKVMQVVCSNADPPEYHGKTFALKIVSKAHLVRYHKEHCVINEKKAMQMLNHPNIVKLFSTFQDKSSLYFLLELCPNGELFRLVYNRGNLPLKLCRFYAAEMVNALEYLNYKEIIHRDLKPENILLSSEGHLKITDFGTAKVKGEDDKSRNRGKSFVGTAEYVSPELLNDDGACPASDLWALGCIIYQMICGKPPFKGESEYLTFQKILNREMSFSDDFDPDARDLVDKLLVLDPEERLGAKSFDEIKTHKFFEGIDFVTLNKQMVPGWQDVSRHTRESSLDGPDFSDDDSSDEEKQATTPTNKVENLDSDEKWKEFLGEGENILFRGLIEKRGKNTFWTKKRMLMLTDLPRFLYISPRLMQVKGEIKWSSNIWVELKDHRSFNVHTPRRTYHIKGLSTSAREWVDVINELIQKHDLMRR